MMAQIDDLAPPWTTRRHAQPAAGRRATAAGRHARRKARPAAAAERPRAPSGPFGAPFSAPACRYDHVSITGRQTASTGIAARARAWSLITAGWDLFY